MDQRSFHRNGLLTSAILVVACSGSNSADDARGDAAAAAVSGEQSSTADSGAQPAARDSGAGQPSAPTTSAQADASVAADAATNSTEAGTRVEPGDAGGDPAPPASASFEGEGMPWTKAAPRATCAAGDMADPGTQGLSGNLRCNVEIAGKVSAPLFLSMAWYKDCAYVNGNDSTTVIDVSDSTKPTVVGTLSTAGMQSNWESMKVHQERGVLVGYQSIGPIMDVYDVSGDCKKPVLKSSFSVGGIGHSGNFSPDGTLYYASSLFTQELFAVDITKLDMPRTITSTFEGTDGSPINTHDLSVEKSGSRGYFTYTSSGSSGGSMAVVDLSTIQARAAGAKGKAVSQLAWPDGGATQFTTLLNIRGKDYLLLTDELGSNSCDDPSLPPFGSARIFDISDERNPKLVSKITTESNEPAHCQESVAAYESAVIPFGIGTHYCSVDRTENPRLLGCGFWEGGVRFFDIRNPWRPKEVAYFDTDAASVPGLPHFRPERKEVWIATGNSDATFYVLKFPAGGVVDQVLSSP